MSNQVQSIEQFDFIVVGGGTAGCAVAGRLAESPNVRVLVIEAGISNPKDIDAITTPARAFELRDSKYDWAYKTTMIDRPDYTRVEKPNTRGKTLGGSSCLNYYTWIPGSAGTFDDWAPYGGDEWKWDNIRKYLYKPATYHDDRTLFSEELKYIGTNGPIPVSHSDLVPEIKGFRDALTQAWTSKGGELTDDVHNGTMRGLWKCTNSIYNGKRSSSWLYLEGKTNVTVLSSTNSKRLLIDDATKKCVGVEVILPSGETHSFKSKYETIVSSGVFESPKLLMLSGIGPKAELAKFNIETIVDSPHVGQNLLDHPILPHVFRIEDGNGFDQHLLRAGLEHDAAVSSYRWRNQGPYTSGLLELVGLPRIDERLMKYPEYVAAKEANGGLDPFGPAGQPHFEIDFVPMFSDAFHRSGTVELNSADPLVQPKINLNFFAEDLDILAMREGIRWVDDVLMNGEGMRDMIREDYPWPMPRTSDAAMDKMILERSQTGFHPCGSTRMAPSIAEGVVDGKLKVFGVENLRVIDASVIPVIPDCRIQNSVYAIAEKGADMIKAEYPELYA
ncbi:Choline dehydrogenase, mitochondrial [Daldinia childiae]|uniref:Choline dehydrogenase, mitochondrial n=1 Tax=Daldinia childiae TaxID=326645 RepID=UPI001446F6CB|nr:Choline dehydrogenase, mitochondrial [Daldinia childiae]KAF3059851.1 Choline dehydrogenase, mitochondrial [Daldinia childiae]